MSQITWLLATVPVLHPQYIFKILQPCIIAEFLRHEPGYQEIEPRNDTTEAYITRNSGMEYENIVLILVINLRPSKQMMSL